jgi:hypothetical protein
MVSKTWVTWRWNSIVVAGRSRQKWTSNEKRLKHEKGEKKKKKKKKCLYDLYCFGIVLLLYQQLSIDCLPVTLLVDLSQHGYHEFRFKLIVDEALEQLQSGRSESGEGPVDYVRFIQMHEQPVHPLCHDLMVFPMFDKLLKQVYVVLFFQGRLDNVAQVL